MCVITWYKHQVTSTRTRFKHNVATRFASISLNHFRPQFVFTFFVCDWQIKRLLFHYTVITFRSLSTTCTVHTLWLILLGTQVASTTLYIKIHHIYTTTLQRNVYILNILLFIPSHLYTKVTHLVLCCLTLVWFPDEGPLRIETCRNIHCNILM